MPGEDFHEVTHVKRDQQQGTSVLRLLAFTLVPVALLVVIVCTVIYIAERAGGLPGSLSRYLPTRSKGDIEDSTDQSEKRADSGKSPRANTRTEEVGQA